MRIKNHLPILLSCLRDWKKPPSAEDFERRYMEPLQEDLAPLIEDFEGYGRGSLHDALMSLDWDLYRAEALKLDPDREEERLKKQIRQVENLLGRALGGDAILFGAFTLMDGYARFDRGSHRVYLGVDESHGRGIYLDILTSHELTHVARESTASVWEGFGLDLGMTHDEFQASQPVIEHLFSEGFSCVISEILNPCHHVWDYVYQTRDSLDWIYQHGPGVDRRIQSELRSKVGAYGSLYDTQSYEPEVPVFAHYVWAWQWVKSVLRDFGHSDPRQILPRCSKEFLDHALRFQLRKP